MALEYGLALLVFVRMMGFIVMFDQTLAQAPHLGVAAAGQTPGACEDAFATG